MSADFLVSVKEKTKCRELRCPSIYISPSLMIDAMHGRFRSSGPDHMPRRPYTHSSG